MRFTRCATGLLLLLALLSALTAQSTKASPLSPADARLFEDQVVPAARREWRARDREAVCEAGFHPATVDVTAGSFTRPQADQKAILYRYCTFGHNFALDGIAIIENGQVLTHICYEGGEDHAIGALPDINAKGISEMVIAGGSTNQGITAAWISIIELAGTSVTKLGLIQTFSDDCGAGEQHCTTTANRISLKPGKVPAFYKEVFVSTGAASKSWKKSSGPAPVTPEKDQVDYALVR